MQRLLRGQGAIQQNSTGHQHVLKVGRGMPDNAKYFTTLRHAFYLLTTFSIPVALVALTLEIDGDVTERGGSRLEHQTN